jgi:hypothetical protein
MSSLYYLDPEELKLLKFETWMQNQEIVKINKGDVNFDQV